MNASQVLKGFDFGSRTGRAVSMLENQAVCAAIDGVMTEEQARAASNKAGTFRFIEACAFIAQRTTDKLSVVHAVAIAAVASAKQESFSFSDAHRVCGAILKEGTDANNIKGVNKARLNKLIGAYSALTTVTSRVSNCMGKNGFLSVLGACEKKGAHDVRVLNASAPFIVAYVGALNGLTEGQFSEVLAKVSKTEDKE